MATCRLCGNQTSEGAKFCRICGTRVVILPPQPAVTLPPEPSPRPVEMAQQEEGPPVLQTMILVARCSKSGRPFTINLLERKKGTWYFSSGFAIPEEKAAKSPKFETRIGGIQRLESTDFQCPLCHADNFVMCGMCQRPTCWAKGAKFTCRWCGNEGPVERGKIESLVAVSDL